MGVYMGRTIVHKLSKRGFTLAELLIVVAIITILAGVSVPVFSGVYKDYQLKAVKDQESAAKAAAVVAFDTGYDSKNNKVDITQTVVCTFLYDVENQSVYVLNSYASIADFEALYSHSIESYGISVRQGTDYSNKVILVRFDGRYCKFGGTYFNNNNLSKGTFEEPILYLDWYETASLIK